MIHQGSYTAIEAGDERHNYISNAYCTIDRSDNIRCRSTQAAVLTENAICQIRSHKTILFVLDTTTAGTLSSLNALLVGLDLTSLHRTHEATGSLPGASKLTGGGLAEEVDLDEVALEGALEGNNGLDQERVGVLHVEMHESHHADTHHLALEEGLELLEIVGLDGGCDELGLLAGSHGRGLDVLDNGHVC